MHVSVATAMVMSQAPAGSFTLFILWTIPQEAL